MKCEWLFKDSDILAHEYLRPNIGSNCVEKCFTVKPFTVNENIQNVVNDVKLRRTPIQI